MPTTARPTFRSRALLALAGIAAVLAAPLAIAAPAQAHDELIRSESAPRSGTAIDVAPKRIELSFSGELKSLGGKANAIVVTDRDGKEVTTGDVEIKGNKLSRALQKLPAGTYDVQWSALSSDGHRIHSQDDYAFTVTKGEKPEKSSAAAKPSASPDVAKPAPTGAAAAPSASSSSAAAVALPASDSPTVLIMWVVAGFLVLAIVLGIILQLTRKKPGRDEY